MATPDYERKWFASEELYGGETRSKALLCYFLQSIHLSGRTDLRLVLVSGAPERSPQGALVEPALLETISPSSKGPSALQVVQDCMLKNGFALLEV